MDNLAPTRSSRLGTLLGFLLFLAVPAGLAYMYPQDAEQAYQRAGQLIRGEYGPTDLIPPGGKEVVVKEDELGVRDVPLPSAQEAMDAEEQERAKRAIEAAQAVEAAEAAQARGEAPAQAEPTGRRLDVQGANQPVTESNSATPVTPKVDPANAVPTPGKASQPSAKAGEGAPATSVATASGAATIAQTPASPALVFEARANGSDKGEGAKKKVAEVNTTNIAGTWVGSFEGPSKGKLDLTVTSNGLLRGVLTPEGTRRKTFVEGRFPDESGVIEFRQTSGGADVWAFSGRITPAQGSGQWAIAKSDQGGGTWSVARPQ